MSIAIAIVAIVVFYLARRSALRRNAACEEVAEDACEMLAAKDTERALSVLSVAGGEFAEAAARAIGDRERGGSSTVTPVEIRSAQLLGPIWFLRVTLVASILLLLCTACEELDRWYGLPALRQIPRLRIREMWPPFFLAIPGVVSLVLLRKLGSALWWCETRQNELLVEIGQAASR